MKERISEVISKRAIDADLIQLSFGPSEKLIGKRFYKDPLIDEEDTFVKQYSFLEWIERFPHWGLTVKMAAETPPPPGVAIKKAAASAEAMDPEKAVEEAYKTVSFPPSPLPFRFFLPHFTHLTQQLFLFLFPEIRASCSDLRSFLHLGVTKVWTFTSVTHL